MTFPFKTLDEMKIEAKLNASLGYAEMSLWTPDGWKPPAGFPRRELMCCPTIGGKTWRVNAKRLLKWCEAQQ